MSEPRAMRPFTNENEIAEAEKNITRRLRAHAEWFCAEGPAGRPCALGAEEWSLGVERGQLIFIYWGDRGRRVCRVAACDLDGPGVRLGVSRRAGAERAILTLTPRASVADEIEALHEARRRALGRLVELAARAFPGTIIERAGLSPGTRPGLPGKYARVLLTNSAKRRLALTAAVDGAAAQRAEAFLTLALLWFERLRRSARAPEKLLIVAGHTEVERLALLHALLRPPLRSLIELYAAGDEAAALTRLPPLGPGEVFGSRPPLSCHLPREMSFESDLAGRILALSPAEIDIVRARQGETLRFHGLPFARVRRVAGAERAWFGIDPAHRQSLDEQSWPELFRLIVNLREHRTPEAADRRHLLYRAAPEAWLESLLRREITRLDPGLIMSPVYAQFRATTGATGRTARAVDLFALRHDGRLVLVELKTSEDREMVLQGADYWRRSVAHHRAGQIARARLFGEAEISPAPPLLYLVAPLLSFHRSCATLARCLTPEMEIYRFDLNEDWRARVRVVRRARLT